MGYVITVHIKDMCHSFYCRVKHTILHESTISATEVKAGYVLHIIFFSLWVKAFTQ